MSRLEELIEKLCPDGVEYKKLSDIGTIFKGMSGVGNKWAETGNCQFIDYKNAYNHIKIDVLDLPFATVKKLENQFVLKTGDILFTSASETPDECAISSVIENEIMDGIFLDDHLFGIRLHESKYNSTYFNYYFRSKSFRKLVNKTVRGVTRFYISMPDFTKIKIPVPPLEVQSEIVRILDNFTELTAELTEKLTAELTARKKQYAHYRDELLTFRDEVEYISLGDLADIKTGIKPKEIFEIVGEYEYINAGTTNSGYVNDYNCEDAVTTPSRGQGGIGFVGYQKDKFWLGPLCYRIQSKNKEKIINKYLYYYLLHNNHLILGIKKEGGVPAVNRVDLEKIVVETPPLEEQQRIVDILDRFDKLCNDISEGLPAEIEARQKQYEYYRDKLLTFKEFKSSES